MKKIQKNIQENYEIIARDYSNKHSRPDAKMRLALPYLKPKMRILDLGCGPGRYYELMPKGVEYVGLDISKGLLMLAKNHYPKAKFINGDMTNERVWKKVGKFDAIFVFACFHHLMSVKDREKTTKFIYEHLKDSGILMIVVWNLLPEKYDKYRQKDEKQLKIPWHISNGKKIIKTINRDCYAFDPEELKKLVEKQGFKVEKEFFTHGKTISDAKEFGILAKKN